MTDMGHTKGPWAATSFRDGRGFGWSVINEKHHNICRVYSPASSGFAGKAEANAKLIAAAPDHALICWAMCMADGRWEPSQSGDGHGEFCINGIRHSTKLDEFGAPMLTHGLRAVILKARGQ